MSIVNFSIPKTLEQQVFVVMKEKGLASKAEFFRFAALRFIEESKRPFANEDDRTEYLTQEIAKIVKEKFKGKKLPSAREQLINL